MAPPLEPLPMVRVAETTELAMQRIRSSRFGENARRSAPPRSPLTGAAGSSAAVIQHDPCPISLLPASFAEATSKRVNRIRFEYISAGGHHGSMLVECVSIRTHGDRRGRAPAARPVGVAAAEFCRRARSGVPPRARRHIALSRSRHRAGRRRAGARRRTRLGCSRCARCRRRGGDRRAMPGRRGGPCCRHPPRSTAPM